MADEEGMHIATAFVTIEPDAGDFKEKLKAAIDEAVAGTDATVPVKGNLDDLNAKIDEAREKLDQLRSDDARATISADDEDLKTKADDATAKLDELDGKEAKATLTADDAELLAKADDATERLDRLDGTRAEATIDADDAPLDEKVAQANAELDALSERKVSPTISAGGGGSEGGGMLAAITGGVAGLMPGIGGAAMGLGLLGATGAMAFGGVAKAVSAAHQAATAIGQTQQQLAATEFSNSVAIRQAQQALGAAHMQAAQDAQQAAMQITQSQMGLAETERNASASMVAAQQAVGQAAHGLADAQFTEQQAQVSLTEARIQARIQLQQLTDQVKDAALSEQSASLAVAQAKYQQNLTDQNAMSTGLDRQQASLAVAQAEQQLTEATQNKANVTTEASSKDRQYFDGQQQLIQAQHAQQDAIYGVAQAQRQLADANTALRNTELNNATAIKEAQMGVQMAEQNAAYTAKRDALAVSQAQQNVTDTLKEQKLAYAATMASANQAALQYAKDMARLTPAGRGMVREILSLRGAFDGMIRAAQGAVAPGMDVFLRGLKSLMPDVTTGVRDMGKAMGTAFATFGKQMDTKAFQATLQGLIRNGIQFANTVLPAVAQFIQELARIGGQKGATSGLSNLLAGLMQGFTGLARVIGQNEKPINALLSAIGKILTAAGPELGEMLALFVRVLEPVTSLLNSKAGQPLVDMLGGIVAGFLAWKLASKAVIEPMKSLFKLPGEIGKTWGKVFGDGGVVSKVVDFGSKVGGAMVKAGRAVVTFVAEYGAKLAEAAVATGAWIAEHAVATATFVAENIVQAASATAAFIAENAATLGIAAGVALLVTGIILLATHWKQVWGDVKNWAEDAWHFISDGFGKYLLPLLGPAGLIALGVIELAQHWSQVWGAIKSAAEAVWDGIKIGARDFVSGLKTVWDGLETIFKTPVNFLIGTVYDKGIARLWNDVVSHIGLSSIKLPVIPQLAGGGVIPGYSPGKDTVPAMLSPGEGVLTPQATQGLGGEQGISAINQHYGSSNPGSSSKTPAAVKLPEHEIRRRLTTRPALHAATFGKFASGGVAGGKSGGGGGLLGSVGGFLGGVAHGVLSGISGAVDIAKIIAAVTTGNTTAFTNAASKLIGTRAAGDLGRMMIGVPKTLVGKAAQELTGMIGPGGGNLPGGSSSAVGALPANWKTIASFLATHGFTKYAAAGVAGNIDAESGGNPEILEIGGGGGGGLIQWTPYPPGYITGDVLRDLYTQLNAILSWGGGPGQVNRAKSPSNAAQIYQDFYERPASLTASLPQRMASANAVYQGMGWGKFDGGGWLPAGMMPVNATGKPEAVLTPAESQAFVTIAKRLGEQGPGAGVAPQVNLNYFGPQMPTVEMQAQQRRDMALLFGGG